MPSLPPNAGGLPPEARPAPSTGSHLADTGHTIQTHWEQHQHVFDLVCRQCGHTAEVVTQPLLPEELELPAAMAVFSEPDASDTLTDVPAKTWVLNTTTGMLHDRSLLSERCNTDQIPRAARKVSRSEDELLADPRYRARCGWCSPKLVENPG